MIMFKLVRNTFKIVSSHRHFTSKPDFDKYCFNSVKSHDRESYLLGLIFPKKYRGVYFAIHAYNVEISTIQDQIPRNSIQAGRLRFQFWKDILQQIYSEGTISASINQPVAQALSYYINHHKLTSRWFERSLEARFQDMMNPANFATMDDLESYAEYSQSSLLYLLLEAMNIKDENAEFAASHVGVCKGIVTLLRAQHHHQTQGHSYLPSEVLKKHELPLTVVLKGAYSAEEASRLQDVINDVASQAYAHLARARELSQQPSFPKVAHTALMPAVSSAQYLEELQRNDFIHISGNEHFIYLLLQYRLIVSLLTRKF